MNLTSNKRKVISIIAFFIFAVLFIVFAYNLKFSSASIDCCHHECNLTDPRKCVGNIVYECQTDCDTDLYQDWCEIEDCSTSGQTCVKGVCVSLPPSTCSDNTSYNTCSTNTGAPWYCDNSGNLIENCGICSCTGSWICGPNNTFCCDNQCNGTCAPTGCTVAYDPDCACQDNNSCCGIGCDNTNDNDCLTTCVPDGCNNNCPTGCTAIQDPDCGTTGCCGDGTTNSTNNEICDVADGNFVNMDLNGKTCALFGYSGGDLACRFDCQNYDPSSCIGAPFACGNNICDAGENCLNCPTECCPLNCSDTCFSLGFECGMQTLCGVSTDCGNCVLPEVCNTSGQCAVPACTDDCAIGEFGCIDLNSEWICGESGDGDSCLDQIITACNVGETCSVTSGVCESSTSENTKLLSQYSNKEVFLISDNDWKDVLPLTPIAVWTEPDGTIHKYPALIYHDESGAIDVDSTIHFMQLYPPGHLTTIGFIPAGLTNLLAAAEPLGAGMDVANDVDNISTADYFSYWSNYDDVVYVEDDYELALLASTYASLINAPLVIAGTANDTDGVFTGKNIICVGSPPRSCDEQYNLEQIQDKYMQVVNNIDSENLNKIIVTNPNDWDYIVAPIGIFNTNKSGDRIQEVFSKHSLSSPFLASAKHELILTVDGVPNRDSCNSSYQNINCSALRDKIKQKVNTLNLQDINVGRKYSALNIVLYDNEVIKQIQDSYYGVFAFFIDNNKIVWLEQDKIEKVVAPGGYSIEYNYTLKIYDILTEQTEILYSFGENLPNEMAMHSDNIVWVEEDQNTGIFSVVLFDINTKTAQTIHSTANQIMGAGGPGLLINNNYIIWNEEEFDPITFEQTNILNEYNISNAVITQLYSTTGKNMYINLTDNTLSWLDNDFMAGTQIMYYMKFSDHNNIVFHNPTNNIEGISLDSDIIVWKEWDTDHYVFHKYDITADIITNNAVSLPQNYFPSEFILYNNKIYMYGNGVNDKNLVAYDIDTGQKQDITNPITDTNNKVGLAIYSDRIIWSESIEKDYMFKDGYLTIIGGPEAIPYFNASVADKQMFASIYHGNYIPDLAYGRIVGLTSSDASSYIARAIFFNDILPNNEAAFFASEANGNTAGTSWLDSYSCPIFGSSDYTVSACVRHYGIDLYPFNPLEAIYYETADFVYYHDHGSNGGINIGYDDLPYMNNIFIDTMACSTAEISIKNYNFALMSMRKGAIAYMGAVQVASDYLSTGLAHSVYYEGLPVGFAFIKYTSPLREETLLGDPTLKIGRTLVNQPLISQ